MTVKTLAAQFCDAGRRLTHPTRPGWGRPCPEPGTHAFRIAADDGSETWRAFCALHYKNLTNDGLNW